MPAKGPHNTPSLAKAEWVAKAVRWRLKMRSTRWIARRLGLHHSTVQEALAAEFERVQAPAEKVQALRELVGEQIEEQIASWRPRSLAGDHQAAVALARFKGLYVALWGLNAPTRTEHTGADGAPIQFDMAHDALLDRLARLAAAEAKGEGDPGADG